MIQHPVTGKKNIYANRAHTVTVSGVSAEESEEILTALFSAVSQPAVRYEHRWRAGDALLWDNRALQHRATPAPAQPRRLVRTTVSNDDAPRENIEQVFAFVKKTCAAVSL
jgi:alpha-ketoglutarate-dependent taurine dioxygenase